MTGRRVARVVVGVLGTLLAACSTLRVVPLPAAGVALDADRGTATVEAEGVQVAVRPSAWAGSPSYLPDYVTPFHLLLANGSPWPLGYDHAGLRLFDEARFQYTALPPAEVERILRAAAGSPVVLAAAEASTPLHPRRRVFDPFWDWWWWPPYRYPPYYYSPLRLDDVYLQALPVGTLQAGARVQGFVYFPRLRSGVSRLSLEFHYRLGDAARVLTVPFGIVRAARERGRVAL